MCKTLISTASVAVILIVEKARAKGMPSRFLNKGLVANETGASLLMPGNVKAISTESRSGDGQK